MSKRSIVQLGRADVRWKKSSTSTIYKRTKKQRKLSEFDIPTASSLAVRQRSLESNSNNAYNNNQHDPIVIEDDVEDFVIKETDIFEIISDTEIVQKQINIDEVFCPICHLDITELEIYQKDAHAELCLEKSIEKTKNKATTTIRKVIKRPELPHIKILEFTNNHKIVVDGFNFADTPEISQYFLSHFHADHYMGLRKSWDHGTIYGSEITINLMVNKFNVSRDIARSLPMNEETWFEPTISVIPLDANHCPGAAVFLFQEWDIEKRNIVKQILHTGDFRSNVELTSKLKDICSHPFDQIYLDTTYLIPNFHFPDQESVLKVTTQFAIELVEKDGRQLFNDTQPSILNFVSKSNFKKHLYKCLFLVGTYTIGKEKLAISIAMGLNTKIYIPKKSSRYKTISQYIDFFPKDVITHNLEESCVHLVPLSTLRSKETIDEYYKPFSNTYENLIGFIPTGWTFTSRYATAPSFPDIESRINYCTQLLNNDSMNDMKIDFILKQYKKHAKYQLFKVPYSEHSSFKDLVKFGVTLSCKQVLATVNLHNLEKIKEMQEWFKAWEIIRQRGGP